jgi:arylsulfatase A-like enzyme
MGAYGCKWVRTPGFDRVAREGILFTNAYTPNAKCAPSRACILTGRNSWQLEAAANHICNFPAKFKTYAETLADHGYFVGHTAKGWAPGDAGKVDGKPRQLTGAAFNQRRIKPPAEGISPIDYAGNFRDFLAARPAGQPFCFWCGGLEPHRGYEFGSGIAKGGKRVSDIDDVPDFWPDNETVRTDMLDYAFEIEHFDRHLVEMLEALEKAGELDNTLVVVTADNGLPFPRCKGQEYEYSNHLPLAAMWKNGIENPGLSVDDYVSFIDFAPTFLELAGVASAESGMQPCQGLSLTDLFRSGQSGQVNPARDHVLIGKERHDIGRPHDWGYPIRGIVKEGYLYLRNFEPSRWPAGNPETGYLNCDGSPTKTECLDARTKPGMGPFWQWSFGKRGEEELYHIAADRDCLKNLAEDPRHQQRKSTLKSQLFEELKNQGDPRMFGNGAIFDAYEYAHPGQRGFYERFMGGEKLKAGWINPTDIEEGPID